MERRQTEIPAKYTLSELLGFLGSRNQVSTPRSRQRQRMSNLEKLGLVDADITQDKKEEEKPEITIEEKKEEPKNNNGLLTEKEKKDLIDDPIAFQKFSRAGNFFARLGGYNIPTPTQETMQQLGPESINLLNQERLAARNRGIGEMLLLLSDALGGKDVAMRALERQKLRKPEPPKEKTVSQIRAGLIGKIMKNQKLSAVDFRTLVAIDPDYADLPITNPDLFDPEVSATLDFDDDISDENLPDTDVSDEEVARLLERYGK